MRYLGISGAGCEKSPLELEKITEMIMEAEESGQQIRKCGSGWVLCNGQCERCLVPRITATNKSEPDGSRTCSNSTK